MILPITPITNARQKIKENKSRLFGPIKNQPFHVWKVSPSSKSSSLMLTNLLSGGCSFLIDILSWNKTNKRLVFFVQKNVGGGGGGGDGGERERSSIKSKEWQNEHLILNSCYRFMTHHRTTQAQRGRGFLFYTSTVMITIIASDQCNKHTIKLGRILVGERVQLTSSGLGPRMLGHAVSSLSSIPHHRLTKA